MEAWYLFIAGQQVGPFTMEQLHSRAAAGELPADAMAFDQASQQWQLLSQVPALAALAPATYFCFRNNEQLGPFTAAQLTARLAAGTLAPTDLVFVAASNDWQPLQASPLWPDLAPPATANTPTVAAPPPAAPAPAKSAPAAATGPTAIQFPCKNHPDRESFLLCRACGADFCEDCLVEVGGSRFCRACQAAGKAAATEEKATKFFGKLFKK